MKCSICCIQIDSVDEMVEAGWTPYFYGGDKEHEFACPGCSDVILQVGEDGEMEVKEKYLWKIRYFADKKPEKREHVVISAIFSEGDGGEGIEVLNGIANTYRKIRA